MPGPCGPRSTGLRDRTARRNFGTTSVAARSIFRRPIMDRLAAIRVNTTQSPFMASLNRLLQQNPPEAVTRKLTSLPPKP